MLNVSPSASAAPPVAGTRMTYPVSYSNLTLLAVGVDLSTIVKAASSAGVDVRKLTMVRVAFTRSISYWRFFSQMPAIGESRIVLLVES